MRTSRTLGGAVALALTATGLAATPATAAPAWLPEAMVAEVPHDDPGPGVVDVDAAGTATAAYYASDALEAGVRDDRVIVATRAKGDAGWSGRQTFPSGAWDDPVLDVDAGGAAAVVYETDTQVVAALRPAGQRLFDAPVEVAGGPGRPFRPVVAVAPDGRVTVVYVVESDGGPPAYSLVARHWRAASGWSGPETLVSPSETEPHDLRIVADHDSTVTVAWAESFASAWTATRPPGGSFTVSPLVTAVGSSVADLAVGADGTVAVSWTTGLHPLFTPWMAVRPPGGVFTPEIELREAGDSPDGPVLAVAPNGVVVAAYTQSNVEMRTVVREVDGDLVHQSITVAPSAQSVPALGVGPDGAATLVWQAFDSGDQGTVLHASRRAPSGSFGPGEPVTLDREYYDAERPDLAVDAAGDVTVVYASNDALAPEPHRSVGSVVLDVAGPQLLWAASGPGTAGSAVPLAVSTTDWSEPVSVAWSFGDGTSGSGPSTSHVYAAAGTYAVSVTATDAVGNSSTATRQVSVGAAAPAKDTTAPVLSRAKLKPKQLPTGKGARLKVTSTEAGRLVGEVQRKKNGRWNDVGEKSWSLRAGANDRSFYGKAAQRRLASGKYRVLLTATDAAGNVSAEVRLRFRVDRS